MKDQHYRALRRLVFCVTAIPLVVVVGAALVAALIVVFRFALGLFP